MKDNFYSVFLFVIVSLMLFMLSFFMPAKKSQAEEGSLSSYDNVVLEDSPVAYIVTEIAGARDLTGRHTVTTYGTPSKTFLPNGDRAQVFAPGKYLEVSDAPDLSPVHTKEFTVEAWLKPYTLNFSDGEKTTGYVYWLGKGEPNNFEYAGRMYSTATPFEDPPRPNRISFYGWSSSGGEGTGGYFQDPVVVGQWIHVVAIFNLHPQPNYPLGTVEIWKNGVQRKLVSMTQHNTVMSNGTAPLRIGTRNLGSFFEGSVAKVAVYDHILSPSRINVHRHMMTII